MNYVEIINNELRISAENISFNTNVKIDEIMKLIEINEKNLQMFGDIIKDGMFLNEQQTLFITSLIKNDSSMICFKLSIIKEFQDMKAKMELLGVPNINKELLRLLNKEDALHQLRLFFGDRKFEQLIKRGIGYKANYSFVSIDYKKIRIRGDKLYVQGTFDKKTYRWSTGLKNNKKNMAFLDEYWSDILEYFYEKNIVKVFSDDAKTEQITLQIKKAKEENN